MSAGVQTLQEVFQGGSCLGLHRVDIEPTEGGVSVVLMFNVLVGSGRRSQIVLTQVYPSDCEALRFVVEAFEFLIQLGVANRQTVAQWRRRLFVAVQ
jgi:hypothetical protein